MLSTGYYDLLPATMLSDHGTYPTAGFTESRSGPHFPQDLAHGPLDYGGLEIPHLYTEQLVAHVQTIL